MSLLSNQEGKKKFLSPGPWLHVNRELIDQMSVTCVPWRKGPSPMCWGYKNTTCVLSQADSGFYVSRTRAGAARVPAQAAVSAPTLLGRGMCCGHHIAFKKERFTASPSPAVKHMLYSDFSHCKLPLVTPVLYLVLAESSRSHQFQVLKALIHLKIGWCLLGRWNPVGRNASQLCTGHRCLGCLWWLTRLIL